MPCAPSGGRGVAVVRIVLDTNVVLSALLWRGAPYRVFGICSPHPSERVPGSFG
jgi:hypothetical protein